MASAEAIAPPRIRTAPSEWVGYGLILLAVLSFSTLGLIIRVSAQELHFSQVALVRSLVGAGIAWAVVRRSRIPLCASSRVGLWGRSIFGALAMLAFFASMADTDMSLGDVAAIRNLAPIFTVAGAAMFLRERAGARLHVAWAVALGGVVLLVRPSLATPWTVAGIALAAAVFSAGSNLFLRFLRREPHALVVLHFSLVSAALMGAIALFEWRTPEPEQWGMLVAAGVCGGIGQLAMTAAYARAPSGRIACMGYLGMVFSYVWSVWLLGESVGAMQLLGALLISAAGMLIVSMKPEHG